MRRIVVSSIIVLLVVGLFTAGYFFYRRYSGDVAEAIKAVPPDAAFVIECRNSQTSLFNLRHTDYWQKMSNLPSMKQFTESLLHIDSVFSADATFSSLWKQKPIIISAHITKADDFDWLFLLEMPRGTDEGDVTGFIKKALPTSGDASKHEYEGVFIYEIAVTPGKTFSFAFNKGILMCSYTSFLVEDAVRQLKNGSSLKANKSFLAVYKTSGKNTDADFYFNYTSFSRFLGIFSNQDATAMLSLNSALAEWSEADVRFNASSVLLNGYTSIKDTSQLMAVLKNQQPQEIRMANILPARTSYLFHIGISDAKSFFDHLQFSSFGSGEEGNDREAQQGGKDKKSHSLKADSKHSSSYSKLSTRLLMKENLTSWVGHEMALAITESNTANYSNSTFACIEARDTAEAMHALKELCSVTEPLKGMQCKTEIYNGHEIGLIKAEGVLKTVYGKLFEGIQKNYFTSVGHYIVFANQASSLRSFIDDADSKKTLSSDNTFKQVLANSEASSNVFVYLNFPRSVNITRSLSSNGMLKLLNDENNWMKNFSALSLQYSNKGDLVYNHFVLQYSEESKKNVSLVWSAECDTSIHMKPQVVTDGSNTYFMVQDDANRLYMFDNSGQLLWKKQMDEKIIGDIHSIDFFHNGTQQFLFNTSLFLYVVDNSGAYLGNFPIRLPSTASNGCTVVDFDNNHNYKIFVACTNQMLYAYEMNGKTMNGWLYNKPAGNISRPLKYFKVKDKDYLFIATTDGKMEFLDRQGALRAKVSERIIASPTSEVEALDTGDVALAHVVFADTTGNVFAVFTNGLTKRIIANHLPQPVFFDVWEQGGDDKEEYVLFGGKTIIVQESDSNILFTHEFRDSIQGLSVIVSGGLLGSISTATNEITIYNDDGTVYPGFPVKGSTLFTTTQLNADRKKYIAAGSSDGNLYLYVVE